MRRRGVKGYFRRSRGKVRGLLLIVLFTPLLLCHSARGGIIISTTVDANLPGMTTFECQDLAKYEPVTSEGTGSLFFDGSELFSATENLFAVHLKSNGHIVLSTENGATLGGLTFTDADLVDYDPVLNIATMLFDGSDEEKGFGSGDAENIDAVFIMDNGNIVLSTTGGATLGGLTFEDGDLVEYNPSTNIATLFLDEDGPGVFSLGEDIDAVHVLPDGNIILSTQGGATLGEGAGQLTFRDGDLVEYNPTTKVATLFFNEDWFTSGADDIAAVTIPEPATICLLGLGALALLRKRSA